MRSGSTGPTTTPGRESIAQSEGRIRDRLTNVVLVGIVLVVMDLLGIGIVVRP